MYNYSMTKTTKNERKKRTITSIVLPLAGITLAFILGVTYTDYQYRDIPKNTVTIEKSNTENELQTKVMLCRGLANTLVHRDQDIVNTTESLLGAYDDKYNGGRPIDPNRMKDIENMLFDRQKITEAINNL